MKRNILILTIVLISCHPFWAQITADSKDIFVSGFAEKITGNEIQYNSGVEGSNIALISRASNGEHAMIWQSAPVEKISPDGMITFINYIGYDSRKFGTPFYFFVDDVKMGAIELPKKDLKEWTLEFDNGSSLNFQRHFVDSNNDKFGFLYYRVPANILKKGQILKFELTGAAKDELTWMMVFKKSFIEGIKLKGFPSLVKKDNKFYQSLQVEVNYLRNPVKATLFLNDKAKDEVSLKTGIQSFELLYPEVKEKEEITVELRGESIQMAANLVLKPVRKWDINFVQHSHTDIGYTRTQSEILAEHLRYIDYALDYCDATDHYPDAAKFRWTCEASWAVDEYLNARSEAQIERLKQRISEGRIEVTGMYFNFSELPDEQSLAASLKPIKQITERGIPVTSAMQNDVNGIGWCMNDYYNTLDVKYLNMGTHGHKALIAFDYPMAFWWVSPSGKKMLAFRAEHYMIGNTAFGIHLKDFPNFERKVLHYLNQLEEKGYEYDMVAIQHSGFMTDNSPPSILASDMIKQWNEKYEWPKIRTSVVSDFFKKIEKKHGNDLQEIQAHWPDWWSDGFGSGAREMAASRNAHTDLIAGQGGLSMAKLLGAKMPKGLDDRIFEVNKALLFYGEHTFGSAESISNPYSQTSMEQREIKESYAWEAFRRARMIDEEALGLLNEYINKSSEPALVVYNTLNWKRDGLINLFIDHEQIPTGKSMRLIDADGKKYPAQILKPWWGGSYWSMWVSDIPPFGYKQFKIEVFDEETTHQHGTNTPADHHHDDWYHYTNNGNNVLLENEWYSLNIDITKGAVEQLYDKELKKNVIDSESTEKLGSFILEKLGDREQLQSTMLPNGSRFGPLTDFTRQPLDSVWLSEIRQGELWNTVRFKGKTETAHDVIDAFVFEIKVYHQTKRIDFDFQLNKKAILKPESFYIAFPFELTDGKIHIEVAGGTMEAGVDQIPGSANDWNTVQNFISIKNKNEQLVLVSPEAPIVQLGNINTGRFEYGATPESNHVYSWPMNNYWTTNFNADQRGMFNWTYNFTSMNTDANEKATQFGWGSRVPFLARVLPEGKVEDEFPTQQSLMQGIPANILLVNATPLENEQAIVFHFREVGGTALKFLPELTNKNKAKWEETDVLGTPQKEVSELAIEAFESKFFKLSW